MKGFNQLETVEFAKRVRPVLKRTYQRMWRGCEITYLDDTKEDMTQGIDLYINNNIKVQEKIRQHEYLQKYGNELCIEVSNGNGKQAEWEYIQADYYLHAYTTEDEQDLACWTLLEVAKIKLLAAEAGGVERLGRLQHNSKHGSASFVAVPINRLLSAIIASKTGG